MLVIALVFHCIPIFDERIASQIKVALTESG